MEQDGSRVQGSVNGSGRRAVGRARLVKIFRTWARRSGALSSVSSRRWWGASDGETMGLGLAGLVLVLSAPMESALWGVAWGGDFTRWVGRLSGLWIAFCLGAVWFLGAWLCDGLFGRRIHETLEPRPWFRIARALVAGFPGLGFASLPLWDPMARRQNPWAYSGHSAGRSEPMGERIASPGSRAFSVFEQSALVVWVGGFALLLLAVTWLSVVPTPGPLRPGVRYAVAAMLHGLGFVGSVAYSRALRRRGGSRRLMLFAGFWVLPLPFCLGAFTPLVLDPSRVRAETLTWAAHVRRKQVGCLGRWAALEQSIRSVWRTSPWWARWTLPVGRPAGSQPTAADRQLLRLGGVKICLLLLDGVAAGWITLWAGGLDLGRWPWTGLLVLLIASGAGAGILIAISGHLAGALRLLEPSRPLGGQRQAWSGAAAVGAVCLGALVGSAAGRGDTRAAGVLLVYGGVAFMVVLGLGLFLHIPFVTGGSEGLRLALVWCGLFLALVVVGGVVASLPGAATGFLTIALTVPLWHGLFFLVTRSRLEGCLDLTSAAVPTARGGEVREALAVQLTVALPLGGLAVPWWLRLRDRRFGGERKQS